MIEKVNKIMTEKEADEIKSIMARFSLSVFSREHDSALHDEVKNKIIPKILGRENVAEKEKDDYLTKTLYTMGLDTKVQLAESIQEEHRTMAINFCDQIVIEYDCKTPSEKALAQVIANAFVRTMEYSNTLETGRNKTVKLNLIGFYSMIGKELDRANRHFLSSLITLRQMKSPTIKINVTAKTAFVAENQQININKEEKLS